MNRNDILALLKSDIMMEKYHEVRDRLRQVDEGEIFHGLYWIAVERPYQGFPIFYAANLLFDLNPACQISCIEAVRAMFRSWDISLQEAPWYLYRQFGMTGIQEVIDQLRSEALSNEENVRLDTVKYWAETIDREGVERIEKFRSME